MFWERFYNLCIQKGTKPNPVAKELGISSGILSRWKNEGSTPNGDSLTKIANYFNVSTDYLLGLTDEAEKKAADISADSLDPDTQKAIDYLNFIAEHDPEALQKAAEYAKFLLQDKP